MYSLISLKRTDFPFISFTQSDRIVPSGILRIFQNHRYVCSFESLKAQSHIFFLKVLLFAFLLLKVETIPVFTLGDSRAWQRYAHWAFFPCLLGYYSFLGLKYCALFTSKGLALSEYTQSSHLPGFIYIHTLAWFTLYSWSYMSPLYASLILIWNDCLKIVFPSA